MAHFIIKGGPPRDKFFGNFLRKKSERPKIMFALESNLDKTKGKKCQISIDIFELQATGEDRVSFSYEGKIVDSAGINLTNQHKVACGRYNPIMRTGTMSIGP